jgi:flagellar basal body-associated protein FliL
LAAIGARFAHRLRSIQAPSFQQERTQMAEGRSDEQRDAQPRKKSLSLLVLAAVGLVSAAAGFATPLFVPGLLGADGAFKDPADTRTVVDLPRPNGEIAFIPFDETVVNLNDGRLSRYLRLKLVLHVDEAQKEQITELVEERKVILKDWLLSYLSDKDMEAIRGAAGQNRMRREIMDHFNTTLFPDGFDRIHDILFEEFNVQ